MIPFDAETVAGGSLGRRSMYGRGTFGRGSRRSIRHVYPSLDDMDVGTARVYSVYDQMPHQGTVRGGQAVRAFQAYM